MLSKTIRWGRRVLDNRSAVRRDVSLALSHVGQLPRLLSPGQDEPTAHSELDSASYASRGDWLNALVQILTPGRRASCSAGTLVLRPPRTVQEPVGERWFFINGMACPPPVAILNGLEIARTFGRPVHLLHIPTAGLAADVLDVAAARTLRKDGYLSRTAFYVVEEALRQHDKVVLVCHCRGAITASYIVRQLLRSEATRALAAKLEIYSIGGIADSLETDATLSRAAGRPVPYVEHFANGGDYFSRIGILSHLDSTAGIVFCIPARTGHLLNQHYLAGIARGDYCQRSSRLYRYARGRDPGTAYSVEPACLDNP
ncbi:hypothetical protein K8B33_00935 [Alcanivorax sp. JB21]|uniref:hypothetical protein n=1 Tax=Alcanivorax limicola TaxID=2874102 RepID=UPI001CBD1374|nr:hypothetical protein [Alcanivorax limicola]MBZ2187648.1 hypothetical protein [Alcanivorax limicola]